MLIAFHRLNMRISKYRELIENTTLDRDFKFNILDCVDVSQDQCKVDE